MQTLWVQCKRLRTPGKGIERGTYLVDAKGSTKSWRRAAPLAQSSLFSISTGEGIDGLAQ